MPRLDLADWLTCCALDCGLQQGENNVEVCIFHESGKEELEHFVPAHLTNELDKQGFDVPGLADFTVNCAVWDSGTIEAANARAFAGCADPMRCASFKIYIKCGKFPRAAPVYAGADFLHTGIGIKYPPGKYRFQKRK